MATKKEGRNSKTPMKSGKAAPAKRGPGRPAGSKTTATKRKK